jgi:hypothetical protein
MTLGEFRKITAGYTDDLELFMDERRTDFKYGLVTSVEKKEIGFQEDPGSEILSRNEVIVISEE